MIRKSATVLSKTWWKAGFSGDISRAANGFFIAVATSK